MTLSTNQHKERRFSFSNTLPKLMPDLTEFMTAKEAAQELGFTVQGVRHLIRAGKLEAQLFANAYLVSRKSVVDYRDKTKGMGKNDPTRGKSSKKDME
jgi:hypothetical protein